VFPRIILGNGATLKNITYLQRIGITHVLNAAEFRAALVYATRAYASRHASNSDMPAFSEVAKYIDEALGSSVNNKVR
ncbi:Dual specificity protein phosphatase 3like, partial [Caligus rogercresseyi]